ncbi:MAG: ABC transporter permease [Polyangiales bacterium]
MSFLAVAIKNVGRNLFRALLTMLGVAVAMLAFVLLRTVLSAWTEGAAHAAQDRVATRHKVTFVMGLPKRYVDDVRAVPGVTRATHMNWFGGRLAGRDNVFFANMATDPESFFDVYDEISVPPAQKQAWMEDRKGALIGATLARQMAWKVGDRVTLVGTIFPGNWEFMIDGIYSTTRRSIDQSSFFFHFKYLDESPARAADGQHQIGWVVSKVQNAGISAQVAKRIDQLFDTRDTQTLSMSERAMTTSFLGMLSTLLQAVNIVSVVILVIMMLILGNTIAMSVRERTREYGVLRAIGFMPHHIAGLVLGEAAAIGLIGGGIGVAIAHPFINQGVGRFMEDNFTGFFPYFRLSQSDTVLALGASVVVAGVAAFLPAFQAGKLDVIDALRRVG